MWRRFSNRIRRASVFSKVYENFYRNTTKSDIVKLYNRRKADLIEEFHKGSFCFALTSDVWTKRSMEDYISVVAHYIDDKWNLQKRIIGFLVLDVAHTDTNICERILNVLIDYDLGNRIIAITLDNASANNVAIETLRPLISGYHDVLLR